MRKIPKILVRRMLPLFLIGVAAVSVAVLTALSFGSSTYHITGQMVYTPLPTAGTKDLYEPPELRTLITMVKSPTNLAQLQEEFHLVEPVRVLDQLIEVDNPSLTNTIDISLDWGDPDQGRLLLDRLMSVYIEQVAQMRKAKLAGYVNDLEMQVNLVKRRKQGASQALRDFNAEVAIDDFENGPKILSDRIAAMESQLDKLKVEENASIAKGADSKRRLQESQEKAAQDAEAEAAAAAAQESLTDIRNRQARLAEKKAEAQFRKEIKVQIDLLRRQYDDKLALFQRRMATEQEVLKIRGELMQLYAKIEVTPEIAAYDHEIAELDKAVVPETGKKKAKQSPIITNLLVTEMVNEQDLLGIRARMTMLQADLAIGRRRLQKLMALYSEGEQLQREVETIDQQLLRTENQRHAFEQMLSYEPHEFTVTSAATGLLTPPSSNRKKLAIMAVLAIGILLAGPMLAWDFYRARQADGAVLMTGFGLPTISPPLQNDRLIGRRQALNTRRWCDQVSLRLQQLAPQPGSVVLLTHHRSTALDATLWYGTAGALAERDERVCVVLAQTDPERHGVFVAALTQPGRADPSPARRFTGLAEYLGEETDSIDEVVVRTSRRNVDVVTAGMSDLSTNRMATRRMDRLFEELKPRYSLILLIGPEFADTLGVEIVARQADGVIVCGEQDAAFQSDEEYTLQSLFELEAPMWGHVVRPDEDPGSLQAVAEKAASVTTGTSGLLPR